MKTKCLLALIVAMILSAGLLQAIPSPRLLPPELAQSFAARQLRPDYELARADSATGFDIEKYVITLAINHSTQFIDGNVVATVLATENLSSINYNLVALNVCSVYVNDVPANYTYSQGIINIPLNVVQGQRFTTKVIYSGHPSLSPNAYGIGMFFNPNYIFTISDPDAGRQWWPCYDYPWDKAIVDLHITLRSDWKVASNGIRTQIVNNGDGTSTTSWIGENPMTTYLVCITAAPYQEINQTAMDGELPIQNFVYQHQYNNALSDLATLPAMVDYYSQVFGPYPFEKYGNATVAMTTFAAMEHQTMTTLGNFIINGQGTYELIIAHELAHQWFGNAVSFLTFKDVWLSEGFATYAEHMWVDHTQGWQAAVNYIRDSYHQYYINWENAYGQTPRIYDPSFLNYFSPPSYEKAASVLHMLRYKIGDAAFFQLIQEWFQTYKHGNAITAEFQAMAEDISGQDLQQFFQQWIHGRGIPNIKYARWQGSSTAGNLKIEARSYSPTSTQFVVDFPLQLNYGHIDSLRVIASPGGHITYHEIPVIEGVSPLWVPCAPDPHHWILNRGYELVRPNLRYALPASNRVRIAWSSYQLWGAASYNVYRSPAGSPPELWTCIAYGITDLHYTDHLAQPNVLYDYWVEAVDVEGFRSDRSNIITTTLVPFTFAQNILVVDETRGGNGSSIAPTDEMVDAFYNSVLRGFLVDHWDIESQGNPSLATLGNYRLVLWHSDDFGQILIAESLDNLASYLEGGGNLIVSGWKTAASTYGFNTEYCPGFDHANYSNSAVLNSVYSSLYPQLTVDAAKMSTHWQGRLPMIYTFSGVPAIYHANTIEDSPLNNQPIAFRSGPEDRYVFFGFPLYFMLEDGVRQMLSLLIYDMIGIMDNADAPAPLPTASLSAYPNPFNPSTTLHFSMPEDGSAHIDIFNLRGQKVQSYSPGFLTKGEHNWQFNGKDSTGRELPSGVYTVILSSGNLRLSRRITLLK